MVEAYYYTLFFLFIYAKILLNTYPGALWADSASEGIVLSASQIISCLMLAVTAAEDRLFCRSCLRTATL